MIRSIQLIIAEAGFFFAWATANVSVRLMPQDHPLRQYHEFSKERVRSLYLEAARAERQHLRRK